MAKKAKSSKGTVYTAGENRWDWENNEPGTSGRGYIIYDPNTKKYSGKYVKYMGSTVAPIEADLGQEALNNHIWNIQNLPFEEEEGPYTLKDIWRNVKQGIKESLTKKPSHKAGGAINYYKFFK